MANLKLNNVVVVAESGGATTFQSGIFKAADGTAAFTIANSTGVLSLSAALTSLGVTGATTLSSTLAVTGATTFSGAVTVPTATASGHAVTKAQLDASVHTPEGTAVKSTGETGTGKFLRIDGDGTSSWQAAGSPSITDNGNAVAMTIDTSEDCTFAGNLFPTVDNSKDLGSASKRWRNIYTTDLHLANDRGNWTVIEEENYLTLRNNKTDKVYKLVMEEIE